MKQLLAVITARMSLYCRQLIGVVFITMFALSAAPNAGAAAGKPIRIGENDWSGQWISINMAKVILEEHMGQDVELVFIDYAAQWVALAAGDLDVAMEIWPSYSYDAHEEWIVKKKKIDVVGNLGVVGTTRWAVPTYVIEGDSSRGIKAMAPDLRTYKDLNKYTSLFSRLETGDKGFCLDAVQSWQAHNEERIENLGLNYVNVYAGTEGAYIAAIEAAYSKGEPLMLCYAWQPHWVSAQYDLTEIELPSYSDECYGVGGESATYACAFPLDPTYIIARKGLKEEYPDVYRFLENINLTTETQEELIYLVDKKGMKPEQVVRDWVAKNEDVWRAWLPAAASGG